MNKYKKNVRQIRYLVFTFLKLTLNEKMLKNSKKKKQLREVRITYTLMININ